ncbi:hypothetical protein G7Y89_g14674 [Cudoniella acicularis]|uniref:Uncharacterized protein n=1 Tax=Cudoniella acicularis TaxID=354080 RepID=A0A8H4QYV0_9HELO|nr:hypothetical protein G7Y89_g14674 [Cudoniella acicularis]
MENFAAHARDAISMTPEEIIQILCGLPDMASLATYVNGDTSSRWAFSTVSSRIIHSVLSKEVQTDVLPEAYAVIKARELANNGNIEQPISREATEEFWEEYFLVRKQPQNLTLQEGCDIAELHLIVRSWAYYFLGVTLPLIFDLDDDSDVGSDRSFQLGILPELPEFLDVHVLPRLQQAFYRYEVYRTIFGNPRRLPIPAYEQAYLFDYFAPWENEQLTCIYECLLRAVTPCVNVMIKHDIRWARNITSHTQLGDEEFIQPILARDL